MTGSVRLRTIALLGMAAGIVFGLAAAAGGDAAASPEPRAPIRLLSSDYEVSFPDKVELTLELEANEVITDVKLFYRLARQEVNIFGYPDFTPGKRVKATFEVKTGGAQYIPSGVDIEYYYRIRDASGNIAETERFHLEYMDPRYDWQRYQAGGLIVLWHDRPRSQVARVADHVALRLEEIKRLMGLSETVPMKAVIVNSQREARRNFPRVSGAASRDHLYAGFAFGDLDVFVLAGLDPDGMTHEMVHLLMDEAVGSPLARIPAWLNEGLAMYFESSSHGHEAAVARAAYRRALMPLRSMGSQPGRPSDVRLFYAQAWSVVDFMVRAYGRERMAALLEALDEGGGIESAVPTAYGMSLDELERRWLSYIAGEPVVPLPSPLSTIGPPAIIAGAVLVAAAAVIVRWLRHVTGARASGE